MPMASPGRSGPRWHASAGSASSSRWSTTVSGSATWSSWWSWRSSAAGSCRSRCCRPCCSGAPPSCWAGAQHSKKSTWRPSRPGSGSSRSATRRHGAATPSSTWRHGLLRPDAPGVTVARQTRLDGRNAALVRLEDAHADRHAVVGEVDQGGALLVRVIDRATAALTAEMLGSMTAAFDMTITYLKTRVQFGVPIGSFQALKHRAARLYAELELARSAVLHAHRTIDEGRDDTAVARAVAIAKARASDAFLLIANEGVQMHGGIGMTDEHDIGFFLKRARATEQTFGDAAYHRDRMARLDGY